MIMFLAGRVLSRLFVPTILRQLPQAVPAALANYNLALPQQVRRYSDSVRHIIIGLHHPVSPAPQCLKKAGR